MAAFASPALAQDAFEVVPIPWVGTAPEVPHDGVAGEPHYLQAVARNCDGPIQYRWDYDGNGEYDMPLAAAPDRWNLGTQHTYADLEQTRLFIARVEGVCGEETATADFPIRVHVDPTRNIRINRAISNGIWFGHISLVRDPVTRQARFGAQGGNWADTALLAQAFMNRGHKHGVDPAIDPLHEDVLWMLHYVLAHYVTIAAPGLQAGENPDINENGIVLEIDEGGVHGGGNYVGGGCLEAISSWSDPGYMIPEDVGAPVNVSGRLLGDVVQDAAEFYIYSQTDIAYEGGIAGGWDYDPNAPQIDSSQVGWAAVGLFAARDATGADVPAWVTERLALGIASMDASRGGNAALAGGYGYRAFSQCGVNYSRSGAMLNALGFAVGDPNDPQVQATVNFIGGIWGTQPASDCWGGRNEGNYYAMYQVAKGMRSFSPPFELIGDGIDWYQVYADYLIANQQPNARWQGDNTWMANREIVHSLGLLVLIPTLFEAPPTAVAQGSPLSIGPGDEVTFYHGGSYALDPQAPIETYRWNFVDYPNGLDLNDDGEFDGEGEFPPEDLNGDGQVTGDEIVWEVVTNDRDLRPTWRFDAEIGFDEVLSIPVTLQVEDGEGRINNDSESVVVEISLINHAPVALANPGGNDRTYTALIGGSVRLDASASFDPDTDDAPNEGFPADSLTFIGWDLDGDGVFETEQAVVDFPVPEDWEIETTRVVQVRVCDDGTWVGTPDAECEGGDCSICRTADARIYVTVGPNIDLGADNHVVEEGKALTVDASESTHPAGRDFEMIWYCDGIDWQVSDDGTSITFDATDIDAPEGGLSYTCSVTAIDDVGVTVMVEFTVEVTNVPPEIVDARVIGEPVEGGVVEIRTRADDVPGDAPFLLYSVDCDGDGTYEVRNTRSNVVECPLDDGVYAPVIRVDDQDGGVTMQQLEPFEVENVPPTFDEIVCPETREGELMVLQVGVSDPADPVGCTIGDPVPDQAQLAALDCTIVWTPTYEQALDGQVDFTLVADDGDGGVTIAEFSCFPQVRDQDEDGLPDSWEERFGTDPTVDDCDADLDADGLSNCDEFEGGTHPRVYEGPTAPELIRPIGGEVVDTATPTLLARNATDELDRPLSYMFWVYANRDDAEPIWTSRMVAETPAQTGVPVDNGVLEENMTYWWTVGANNGLVTGPRPERDHFVLDAIEEPAPAPRILSPDDEGTSPDGMPPVVLTPVEDPDPGDELTYECEAATDAEFENVADTAEGEEAGGQVAVDFGDLAGNTTYWLRCRAIDQDGEPGLWSESVQHSLNQPPVAAVDPPVLELVEGQDGLVDGSPSSDPDAGELTYDWDCPDALETQANGDSLAVTANAVDAPAEGRSFACRLTVTDAHGASDSTDFVVRVRNAPPTVIAVVCPATFEGTPVDIAIETSDPGGDQVRCDWASPAPDASALAGCTVSWTPTFDQAVDGEVAFSLMATDDDGASTPIDFVCTPEVLDEGEGGGPGNGLPDSWEDENGVDDPDGDPDGDGITNREEFEGGTDPNAFDGPTPLSLISPVGGVIVDTLTPTLWVNNGTDGLDRPLTYTYSVFDAADADEPLITSEAVDEGDETTGWAVPADILADNGTYWWTARADNGLVAGPWADRESFRVNADNEPPSAPVIVRPEDGDEVPDNPLRVGLTNSVDPDPGAKLTYLCEVAKDDTFEEPIAEGEAAEGENGTTDVDIEGDLDENQTYWIRCRAIDEHGAESDWSEPVMLVVNNTNEPPSKPEMINPVHDSVVMDDMVVLVVGNSIDPDGDLLTYHIEVSDDPLFAGDLIYADSAQADDPANDDTVAFGPVPSVNGTYYYRAWAHDGLVAGPMNTARFEVLMDDGTLDGGIVGDFGNNADGGIGEDTINGGGCACDADGSDPAAPIALMLGVLMLGLRRRNK